MTKSDNTLAVAFEPPKFFTQPVSQTVIEGSNVVFSVAATGLEPLAYQWQLNGTNLEETDAGHISGANEAVLTITDVSDNDEGDYTVVVNNASAPPAAKKPLSLCSDPPEITQPPINRIVIQGSNAVFTVAATGTEPLEYQWQHNGKNLADDDGGQIDGATNDTLTISEVNTNDAGSYSVIVSNVAGTNGSVVVTLTVAGMQSMIPPPEYNALLQFYKAADGSGWKDDSGWLDPDSAEWFGVEVTNLQFDAEDNFILNSGNVCEISLPTNNLAGNLPNSVNNFTWLETLDLSGNALQGNIPAAFTFLNHLETIDLSSNQFTGVIPVGLGNLGLNLKTLDLSGNQLSGGLASDLHSLSALEMLNLSQNSLSNAVSLGIMPQLTTLDLSGNAFTGSLTNVGVFPRLQSMDLSGNALSGTIPVSSGYLLALCEGTLQHFDLSDNNLSGPSLTWVNLHSCRN